MKPKEEILINFMKIIISVAIKDDSNNEIMPAFIETKAFDGVIASKADWNMEIESNCNYNPWLS